MEPTWGPHTRLNEAQMEPKWSQKRSDTCVLNHGANKLFLCTVLGLKMDPHMAPFSRLELSFGALVPHLFLGPIWSSIVDDLGVDVGSLLSSFFVMFRVRARICKTLICSSSL